MRSMRRISISSCSAVCAARRLPHTHTHTQRQRDCAVQCRVSYLTGTCGSVTGGAAVRPTAVTVRSNPSHSADYTRTALGAGSRGRGSGSGSGSRGDGGCRAAARAHADGALRQVGLERRHR
jgi:hypothetical protein